MNTVKRPFKVTLTSIILIAFGIFELFVIIFLRLPSIYETFSSYSSHIESIIIFYTISGFYLLIPIASIWLGYRIWNGRYWVKLMSSSILLMLFFLLPSILGSGFDFSIESNQYLIDIILLIIFFSIATFLLKDKKTQEYFKYYQTVDLPKKLKKDYETERKLSTPLIIGGIILLIIGFLMIWNFIPIDIEKNFPIVVISFMMGVAFVLFGLIIKYMGKSSLEETIKKIKE